MGLLRQDNAGEDNVEGHGGCLIAEDDADGVEPLAEAVKELGGEIHLFDGVVDVGEAVSEQLQATGVLGDGEIALLQVAVLAV